MMEYSENKHFFFNEDCTAFRDWLSLNLNEVTWQGKYTADFDKFWEMFFLGGLSVKQLMVRYSVLRGKLRPGPLDTWFKWLWEKTIIFLFIHKSLSIKELEEETNLSIGQLSLILRNYFIERFPHLDTFLNEKFHLSSYLNEKQNFTYSDLLPFLDHNERLLGSHEEEVMNSLEVTLYDDWKKILSFIESDFLHKNFNAKKIKEQASFKKQRRFFQEFTLLLALGVGLIYSMKYVNVIYEDYLAKKIELLGPELFKFGEQLEFKQQTKVEGQLQKELREIDELENERKLMNTDFKQEERFDAESDVILTSIDSLPSDFQGAEFEKSEFEEILKGGYRDERFGSREVYRVMTKTVHTEITQNKLNELLIRYQVKKVNTVRPGTVVPGGIYYNLLVPKKNLKEFLGQIMKLEESILYISKTRRKNPPGKAKVFIWMKQI